MAGASHPDIASLRRVRNLSRLDDRQLEALAAEIELETAEPGQCLIELGSCAEFGLYLVDGALRAITHDGQETRFAHSDEGELFPIAGVRPSLYRVVADQPARYFRLSQRQLTEFTRDGSEDRPGDDIDVVEVNPDAEQEEFAGRLFRDLLYGKLQLPSLPGVAERIHRAFADNLVTAETIRVIIQSDPVITAKLIMVANSALYGGRATIESLHQAVVRLGLDTTRKLVMTYAVKELFKSDFPEMKAHMHAAWKHSQHVASLCRLLAGSLDGVDPEQAQLAGLVHDIGEVAILQYVQHDETLRKNRPLLLETVKSMRPQVTGMLLEQWKFGPEFVTVGRECEHWFRNPSDQPDLCDLVLIAQYHAMIGTPEQSRLPPVVALPAFAKLGMGDLEVGQIIEFLNQSRDKLRSVEAVLGDL